MAKFLSLMQDANNGYPNINSEKPPVQQVKKKRITAKAY